MESFTDKDMRDQVTASLDAGEGGAESFNVNAIVDALQQRFGTMPIGGIPEQDYWAVVEEYAR